MTNTQLLQAIKEKSPITDEMVAQADKMLAQVVAKNEKAKANKIKKADTENAPIIEQINEFFNTHTAGLGNEIATYCKVSTSKAIALLKKMTTEGLLVQYETKIAKVGTRQMWRKKD